MQTNQSITIYRCPNFSTKKDQMMTSSLKIFYDFFMSLNRVATQFSQKFSLTLWWSSSLTFPDFYQTSDRCYQKVCMAKIMFVLKTPKSFYTIPYKIYTREHAVNVNLKYKLKFYAWTLNLSPIEKKIWKI